MLWQDYREQEEDKGPPSGIHLPLWNSEPALTQQQYTSGSTIAMTTSILEWLRHLLINRQNSSTETSAVFESVSLRVLLFHTALRRRQWTSSQFQCLTSLPKPSPATYPTFINAMIHAGLPPQLALLEARDLMGPGTNTTSTTLAHILWGLAHDTRFQDGIVGDLGSAGWPGDLCALEKLPRLKAAIKEGIRWTAAACAMLPRIVPAEGVTLFGHFIPGGVSE